jgi:DNA-binding XRE family transcriptional regulator
MDKKPGFGAKIRLRLPLWTNWSESDSIWRTLRSSLENPFLCHGKAIKHFREDAGLTQEQVWKKCGVHYTEISRLETGEANPTFDTIARVAEGLGVSVSRIFSLGEAYAEGNVR